MITNKKHSRLIVSGMAIGLATIGSQEYAKAADRVINADVKNTSLQNGLLDQIPSKKPNTQITRIAHRVHRYQPGINAANSVNDQAPDPSLVAMLSVSGMLGILFRRRTVRKQVQV